MKKPALNISFTLTCPDPKIIALGGVATGSINAHESDIVAGISTKRMSERKSTTEKKDYSPRNVNRSSPFEDSAAIARGENKQYKRTQNGIRHFAKRFQLPLKYSRDNLLPSPNLKATNEGQNQVTAMKNPPIRKKGKAQQ